MIYHSAASTKQSSLVVSACTCVLVCLCLSLCLLDIYVRVFTGRGLCVCVPLHVSVLGLIVYLVMLFTCTVFYAIFPLTFICYMTTEFFRNIYSICSVYTHMYVFVQVVLCASPQPGALCAACWPALWPGGGPGGGGWVGSSQAS